MGERKGVFADVLQETLLAAYRRGGEPGAPKGSRHLGEAGRLD